MKTTSSINVVLSRSTLRETVLVASRFLRNASKPEILRQLQAAGYTDAESEEGWRLYLRVTRTIPTAAPPAPENKAAEAVAEISAWIVPTIQRAHAVWTRKFPEVAAYALQDIDGSGNDPLYETAAFLGHCKELQNGADRKATRKMDHAALAALAERGIGDDVLKHMTSLLEVAQTKPKLEPLVIKVTTDERTAAITELYIWLRDWRETARAVIKNRAHLISLGVAKKRSKKTATPTPPVVAVPQLPPAPLAE